MKLSKLIAGLAVVAGLALPASGDVRAQGATVSLWGGYFHTFGPEVEGFSNGTVPGQGPIFNHFTPDADDGGFFGAAVGVPVDPGALLFANVELYFEGQITERDKDSDRSVNFAAVPISNGNVGGFASANPLSARLERERYEFGANLSLPTRPAGPLPFSLVITPFGGFATEDAQSHAALNGGGGFIQTDSDIDWWFLGVLVGTEHVRPLGGGIDLVMAGAGGIYAYDADGGFATSNSVATIDSRSDSDSDVGFRAKASLALRTMLSESVRVSVFGGLDYWSDVPYSKLPDPSSSLAQSPAHIATDDVLDLKAGLKLTLFLDGLM